MKLPVLVRASPAHLSCAGQGWQGRWGALTSAPRPAPRDEISTPRLAPPSAPSLAALAWSSRSPVDLILELGWHPQESRSGAPRHARAVSHAWARRRACCAFAQMLAARVRIHPSRRRYATTCCKIMNDALLMCICKCAYGQVGLGQAELQN